MSDTQEELDEKFEDMCLQLQLHDPDCRDAFFAQMAEWYEVDTDPRNLVG